MQNVRYCNAKNVKYLHQSSIQNKQQQQLLQIIVESEQQQKLRKIRFCCISVMRMCICQGRNVTVFLKTGFIIIIMRYFFIWGEMLRGFTLMTLFYLHTMTLNEFAWVLEVTSLCLSLQTHGKYWPHLLQQLCVFTQTPARSPVFLLHSSEVHQRANNGFC